MTGGLAVQCPRCSQGIPSTEDIGKYPGAMSRWNSAIEICSKCGVEEALAEFSALMAGEDPASAIHPITGNLPWDTPPAGL